MEYCSIRKSVIFFLFFFLSGTAIAQTSTVNLLGSYKELPASLTPYLVNGQTAVFDKTVADQILRTKPAAFNFSFRFENKEWIITLTRSDFFSKGFAVATGSKPPDQFIYNKDQALHYKGTIKGKPHSFAAVTVLADKLVAVIADEKGNINIGAINTAVALLASEHIIYREADLLIEKKFECNTPDAAPVVANPVPVYTAADATSATVNDEPVDIYFEADYTTYLNNGSSIDNVVNYVTALFNVVHTLYENDSISTKISGIKVWNTQDPYNSLTTTATVLNAFSANMANGFPVI
ncbi:MAG: hypothetical protein IPP72_19425 [Chitinophagaceae bacterium]|nr:hypothetical protein [Chitinophagaceae bacterium]